MGDAKISLERVKQVAKLASLRLSDAEVEGFSQQLGAIVEYMATLDDLDVSAVEPTFHPVPMTAPARPDEIKPCTQRDRYLAAAPKSEAGGFAVPKVLDGE